MNFILYIVICSVLNLTEIVDISAEISVKFNGREDIGSIFLNIASELISVIPTIFQPIYQSRQIKVVKSAA